MFIFYLSKDVKSESGVKRVGHESTDIGAFDEWYVNFIEQSELNTSVIFFMHLPSQMVVITPHKILEQAFLNFKTRLGDLLQRQKFKPNFIENNFNANANFIVNQENAEKLINIRNSLVHEIKSLAEAVSHQGTIDWNHVENGLMNQRINDGNAGFVTTWDFWKQQGVLLTSDEMPKMQGLNEKEDLMMDNALMQLQLEGQQGAIFNKSEDLDAEVENLFLKRVMAFEEASKNPKYTTPRKMLGNMQFPDSSEFEMNELEQQFEKVLEALATKNIAIDFLAEYDTKTKYDFIVDELLDHEMDDIPLADMTHCFIYEEFHPNAEMDIESRVEELMDFLKKPPKEAKLIWFASDAIVINGENCDGNKVIDRYNELVAAKIWPEDFKYEIVSIWYDDERLTGRAELRVYNVAGQTHLVDVKLACEYDWWEVVALNV